MRSSVTLIGAATLLFDFDGLTILTDPTFDPEGSSYELPVPALGASLSMTRTIPPALPPDDLPPIDAVLLSHDLHPDHLDAAGRRITAEAGMVITTLGGASRLSGNVVGLRPGDSHTLSKKGSSIVVTATPARHGPEGVERVVGDVIGFLIRPAGAGAEVFISGDTVDYPGLDAVASYGAIGSAFLHVGHAHFPQTGDMAFTMDAREASRLAARLDARTVVPVHYDGWSHFGESPVTAGAVFARGDVADRVRWLEPGKKHS